MTDWMTILGTTAAGLGATGVTAGAGLLINNALKLARIETKLDAHIEQEDQKDETLNGRLGQIESKLPNGEVEQTWKMVSDLYEYFETDIAQWREEKAVRTKAFHDKEDKR